MKVGPRHMRVAKAPHENTNETRTIKVGPRHMMVANVHMMITLKGHEPERLELLEH
jgi:hypothetical protein